ncbi:MAG: ferrous iron transport protein A [Ignavibacteria bacterium]|nr:ferrous iron transport protein A [Ignavibacteria bacterium]
MQSLIKYKRGDKVRVMKINAGKKSLQRLLSIGIVPGNIIEVKRVSSLGGPVLVSYQGSEIAIGFGLASKVIVEKAK